MQVFDASSVSLDHLEPESVSYEHKNIRTQAIQVTAENIGKLGLEFEVDLFYTPESGLPYFTVQASRGTEAEPLSPKPLTIRLGSWIVPLWGELHVYPHDIFVNTFTFDRGMPYEVLRSPQHASRSDAADLSTNKQFKPNDRVFVGEDGDNGTVTVVNDHDFGIVVRLDRDGQCYSYRPEDLQKHSRAMENFVPGPGTFSITPPASQFVDVPLRGTVEGPSGTAIMPPVK